MKRLLVLMILMVSAASLFATGEQEAASTELKATDKLVVYSPNSDGLLKATIPAFEKLYNVKVEVISAGTGELFKRIQGEAGSPYADVVFGGAYATYQTNADLFQPYTSVNNDKLIDIYRNDTGYITSNVLDGSLLLVNKNLIGNIQIKGYKDLLNPALKGKIVSANPTASSSAYAHLTNMLAAIGKGNYESQEAWDFVKALFANTVVIDSSSAVWKGVRDGEYAVGLSYEDPAVQLVRDGALHGRGRRLPSGRIGHREGSPESGQRPAFYRPHHLRRDPERIWHRGNEPASDGQRRHTLLHGQHQ